MLIRITPTVLKATAQTLTSDSTFDLMYINMVNIDDYYKTNLKLNHAKLNQNSGYNA